jgi:hypothetical protein
MIRDTMTDTTSAESPGLRGMKLTKDGSTLNLKLLAIYVVKQAIRDLEDSNLLWKLDAYWFLTAPTEEQKIWMWMTGLPEDAIKKHAMRVCKGLPNVEKA